MELQKIKKLTLKEVFGKEDESFTPWLVKHLDQLSAAIGIPMVSPKKEVKLETLRPDIIAYTDKIDGDEVIIENQYDKSDSYHIGKLLSYAAYEKRAKYAILVTEGAREEHIEAIKALNEKKVCDCNFCLVNANCYQIADSPIAISFDVVVGIDPEIINVTTEAKKTLSAFWKFFTKKAAIKDVPFYAKRSGYNNTDNWFNGYIGNSHANFVAKIARNSASVGFWFFSTNAETNKENYATFYQYKDKIDKDFGKGLVWVSEENRKSCKIEYQINDCGGYSNKDNWEKVADKMLDVVKRMDNVLSEYYELLV